MAQISDISTTNLTCVSNCTTGGKAYKLVRENGKQVKYCLLSGYCDKQEFQYIYDVDANVLCTDKCPPATASSYKYWELVQSGTWTGFRKCAQDCSDKFIKVDGESMQCVEFCGASRNDVFYFNEQKIC